ncbi:hypothetical protein DSECCO2_628410 [anaerobic digester metagenome]
MGQVETEFNGGTDPDFGVESKGSPAGFTSLIEKRQPQSYLTFCVLFPIRVERVEHPFLNLCIHPLPVVPNRTGKPAFGLVHRQFNV